MSIIISWGGISAYLGNFLNTRVVEGLVAAGANQMLNDNKAVLIIHGTLLRVCFGAFVFGRDVD
jgi:hypothetical protein